MSLDDYLVREVKREEYQELKKQKEKIINSVMNGFNDHWKPKVKGIKTTFKYNSSRSMIGIYVIREGQQQLVVERQGLNEAEDAVVGSLYRILEQELDRIRLPKEEWGD